MGWSALTCCAPSCNPNGQDKIYKASSVKVLNGELKDFCAFVSGWYGDLVDALAPLGADDSSMVKRESFKRYAEKLGFPGDAGSVFDQLDVRSAGTLSLLEVRTQLTEAMTMSMASSKESSARSRKGSKKKAAPGSGRSTSPTNADLRRTPSKGSKAGSDLISSSFGSKTDLERKNSRAESLPSRAASLIDAAADSLPEGRKASKGVGGKRKGSKIPAAGKEPPPSAVAAVPFAAPSSAEASPGLSSEEAAANESAVQSLLALPVKGYPAEDAEREDTRDASLVGPGDPAYIPPQSRPKPSRDPSPEGNRPPTIRGSVTDIDANGYLKLDKSAFVLFQAHPYPGKIVDNDPGVRQFVYRGKLFEVPLMPLWELDEDNKKEKGLAKGGGWAIVKKGIA